MKRKKTIKKSVKNDAKINKQVVGFIGAGNMAHAMMRALYRTWDMAATDVDWKKIEDVHEKFGVEKAVSVAELVKKSEVVIIAVKPVNVEAVLDEIKSEMRADKTIISIVAGVAIKKIQDVLGKVSIVRVMPNTPVLVNEGTCAYAVSKEYNDLSVARFLLQRACRVAIEMDEDKLDAVTAISGSGPAYFFYMAEAMVKAGLDLGLSGEHLRDLIGQTMKGAGEMILKSKDDPAGLRARVTSKGGTTEQAIRVMDEKCMNEIIIEAVIAAKNRAKELGK
jgi:pyrroline-5-carboxylate reductase